MTAEPTLFDAPAKDLAEGLRRRDEGMKRADDHAERDWKDEADDAIRYVASQQDLLTADDVWILLEYRKVAQPHEPRAMGPRLSAAARAGVIVNTRRVVASQRPVTHGSWLAEWRSLIR